MSRESVAAIIPTMDRPEYAKRAIESAISQEHDDLEIIVVDGSDTDDTAEVVSHSQKQSHSKEITYIRNEEPQGLPAARNQAVNQTDAKYIAFLDDDDMWYPDKIGKQLSKFQRTSDSVAAIHTGYESVNKRGKHLHTKVPTHEGDIYDDLLIQNVIGPPSTVMVLRSAYEHIGGFNQEFRNQEDWEFYLRLSENYEYSFVKETLMKRTIHEDTMSHDTERQKRYRERILNMYDSELRTRNLHSEAWAAHHRKAGIMSCRDGCILQGRRQFKMSLEYNFNILILVLYLTTYFGSSGFNTARRGKQIIYRMVNGE